MRMHAKTDWQLGIHAAGKAIKIAGLGALASISVIAVAVMVFWDADFYAARDRYEHARLALFGPWSPKPEKTVKDIFDEVDSVSLFKKVRVPGVGTITTGARYESSEAVTENRPVKRWCYLARGKVLTDNVIELGEQAGALPPQFIDTASIDQLVLDKAGVSAERLAQLAHAHCKFTS